MLVVGLIAVPPRAGGDSKSGVKVNLPCHQDKPTPARRPVDVFAESDGVWRGTFVVYDTNGEERDRITVRQEYKTIDGHTQTVKARDRMSDGTVITGEGANSAHRSKNGGLTLRCRIDKSNGETSEHTGRIFKGPGGRGNSCGTLDPRRRSKLFVSGSRSEATRRRTTSTVWATTRTPSS